MGGGLQSELCSFGAFQIKNKMTNLGIISKLCSVGAFQIKNKMAN